MLITVYVIINDHSQNTIYFFVNVLNLHEEGGITDAPLNKKGNE